MKKQLFLLIISSLLVAETSGQYWYSKYYGNKELSELNSQELSNLYKKANIASNAGLILTIAGTTTGVIGLFSLSLSALMDQISWGYSDVTSHQDPSVTALVGAGIMAVGIPTWIIGSHRKQTIRDVINSQEPGPLLQITPSFQYDHLLHGCSSGLAICITF